MPSPALAPTPAPILELRDVRTHFPISSGFLFKRHVGTVKAVDGVTLSVARGEVLGLVGESGCGKSTLARTILQLVPTTGGTVVLSGQNLTTSNTADILTARRDLQMVFQDPYASLNPRMTVFDTLAEPLLVHGVCSPADINARVATLMRTVGLARRAFDAMKAASALREALWAMVSDVHLKTPGVDYAAHARDYLARFERLIARP